MSSILDKINEKTAPTESAANLNTKESEEGVNISFAIILSIAGLVLSIGVLISLVFAFSYDLCIFLDKYIIYIAGVIGLFLIISVYMSAKSLKTKISFSAILNILLSLTAIVIVIIPFLTGLIYF